MAGRWTFGQWGIAIAVSAIAMAAAPTALAQTRPDAGSLQDSPRAPTPPAAPQTPRVDRPATPSDAPTDAPPDTRELLTPAAFRIEGNTLFDSDTLLGLLRDRVGRPASLASLQAAARELRQYYRDRGYLLTEVYLPEQALPPLGATVRLAVVEARLGAVRVRGDGDGAVSENVRRIVLDRLRSGAPVTEALLDEPVLLLRDLVGYDASAVVEPGERVGEADVTVIVRPAGERRETQLGLDNHGTRSAGAWRFQAAHTLHHVLQDGDALAARVQRTDRGGNTLLRLSYAMLVPGLGSRATLDLTQSRYALGEQFAALGASGDARGVGLSLLHPLRRSRQHNLYAGLLLDHKRLNDNVAVGALTQQRSLGSVRLSLLGNVVHDDGERGAYTGYALSLATGRLRMDAATLAADQAPGGSRSAGRFTRVNGELQHVRFLSPAWSLHGTLQWQHASRNLASAEKMSLGGPSGVRGYPVGEALGDTGHLLSVEARWRLAGRSAWPLVVSGFYDRGTVRPSRQPLPDARNRIQLASVGLGLSAGQPGQHLVQAQLAWRTTDSRPANGDPDRRPRWWLTTQHWF